MKNFTLNRSLSFTILLFFTCVVFYAQPFIQEIEIHTPNDFVQHSVAKWDSGEYAIVGTVTPGVINGNSDVLLLKTDDFGNVQWMKYLSAPDHYVDSFAGSVIVDGEGNVLVIGYIGENNGIEKLLFVVKVSPDGELISETLIRDLKFGMGLYGLDLEQTQEGYIVVGTGVEEPTENAPKYSFALGFDHELNAQWNIIFRNNSVPHNRFNSINHILRIPDHPLYNKDVYLLSGTFADHAFDFPLIFYALIDGNGNFINARAHDFTGGKDFIAIKSIYRKQKDEGEEGGHYYVLRHYTENPSMSLIQLDENLNAINHWFIDDALSNPGTNILNGMEWETEEQESIVFSGHRIETIPDPEGSLDYIGYPVAFAADINNNPPTVTWNHSYNNNPFDFWDFNSIDIDYIINPTQSFSSPGSLYQQSFYQPKPLEKNISENWQGFQFSYLHQNTNGNFCLSFFNTDLNGNLSQVNCSTNLPIVFNPTNLPGNEPFDINSIEIEQLHGIELYDTDLNYTLTCETISQKKLENSKDENIKVWPNPTKGLIYIDAYNKLQEIVVYDITGKIIEQNKDLASDSINLDLTRLTSGLYIIKVVSNNQMTYHKIIKR